MIVMANYQRMFGQTMGLSKRQLFSFSFKKIRSENSKRIKVKRRRKKTVKSWS